MRILLNFMDSDPIRIKWMKPHMHLVSFLFDNSSGIFVYGTYIVNILYPDV
jgi:hypothetical protein